MDKTRYYIIEWFEKKTGRYGHPIIKTSGITLSNPTEKTDIDTKAALDIFIKKFGNLKQNEIIRIKECDENGQIGEDIVPSEDKNAIIPIRRRAV